VGVAIVVVAVALVALIVSRDRLVALRSAPPTAVRGDAPARTPTPTGEVGPPPVRAALTSNLYAQPDRGAEVVAILPEGRLGTPDGRTLDGRWIRLAYPVGSDTWGWANAAALDLDAARAALLPVLAAGDPGAVASATPVGVASADPAVVDVFLIEGRQLAVSLKNLGGGPLTDATMTLHVVRLEGDIVGVLTVGPTSLEPGAGATVETGIDVYVPGAVRVTLETDANDPVAADNIRRALLIPSVN
jgi:hypothetical protein